MVAKAPEKQTAEAKGPASHCLKLESCLATRPTAASDWLEAEDTDVPHLGDIRLFWHLETDMLPDEAVPSSGQTLGT